MDRDNFNAIIQRYLDKFDYTNGSGTEEWFKWEALYHFQKHWDLDAPDFVSMFSEAVKEFSVLIDNNHAMPINGLKELAKKPGETEFVRDALRKLFETDNGDLALRQKRAEAFVESINRRIMKYWPGSHLYPQSLRSAILLMAMQKPRENYILFWSRAAEWANRVEFGEDIGAGASFSLPVFYQMCDELRTEIEARPELKACDQKRAEAAKRVIDAKTNSSTDLTLGDDFHLLVYDIIYCAYCYNLYADIPCYDENSAAKRIIRAKERQELDQMLKSLSAEQKRLAEIEALSSLPLDLVGRSVQSKFFGMGTITYQSSDKIKVQFDVGEKGFIFPDAFIGKHLISINESDTSAIQMAADKEKEKNQLIKKVSNMEKEYAAKVDTFERKWKKTVHNGLIESGDD